MRTIEQMRLNARQISKLMKELKSQIAIVESDYVANDPESDFFCQLKTDLETGWKALNQLWHMEFEASDDED